MAALEELSTRLMKPAKDLADWNFPFTEILEEYYTLVETQRDVNLNKAALVIQNSANTYTRRVEYLFQDTSSLVQTFADQEAEKNAEKKDGKRKNTVIDTIDFEPIDFAQYVAKNNNIKNRNGAYNAVKLLSQRFPQLENSSRPSKLEQTNSIETDQDQDNDQDIGRKYAFRCNQYITASGMLVEHLKPEVWTNNSSSDKSVDVPTQSLDSCVDLNVSEENHEFARDIDPKRVLDNQRCAVSTPLPDTDNDFMDTSFTSAVDSGRGSSIRTMNRPESSLSSDRDGNWDSLTARPCSSLSIGDLNSLVEPVNDTGLGNKDETALNDVLSSKRGAEERGTDENLTDYSDPNADAPSGKSDALAVQQFRRSKRLRSLFDAVTTSDSRPLEPIPFEGVPDEIRVRRTEFKLPCPISLLTFKERPQKRKMTSEARKRRCLEKLLRNDSEIGTKKMTMYSPTRQLFFPFMKEELKLDLPKYLDKHLRNLRDLEAIKHYEAVTNTSMDLLGYKTRDREPDSPHCKITDTTEIGTTPDIPDSTDDFPMPDTPESSDSPEPLSVPTSLPCTSRIERLVHEIHESADVRTEQEEAVIRWHENIQLKLREVKGRPKFEMADYTGRVMKYLKDNNGSTSFARMVRQDKPQDAARYLLASLMLANKYNLRIDTDDDEGNLTLLLLKE